VGLRSPALDLPGKSCGASVTRAAFSGADGNPELPGMTFHIHDWMVLFETRSHEEQSALAKKPPAGGAFLLAEANHKTG
jgi:hypothetical protein